MKTSKFIEQLIDINPTISNIKNDIEDILNNSEDKYERISLLISGLDLSEFEMIKINNVVDEFFNINHYDERNLTLVKLYKNDKDFLARDLLIIYNQRLINSIINKIVKTKLSSNVMVDLKEQGKLALIDALKNFDETKNIKLSTYAYKYIYYRILNYYYKNIVFDKKTDEDEENNDGLQEIEKLYDDYKFFKYIDRLDPLEKEIILLHLGFNDENKKISYSKIGKNHNLSRERIRQIATKGLFKLEQMYKESE